MAGSLAALSLGAPLGMGALAVLAAVLAAVVTTTAVYVRRRRLRGRSRPVLRLVTGGAGAGAGAVACPLCLREYPAGTVFCPIDARKLVPAEEANERRSSGTRCPRCRRAFEAATRYCPFDAEELLPHAVWEATHAHDDRPSPHELDHELHDALGGCGKICPVCAARYGLDASFCGKDGSELVIVN